jgi:hypothetical protein
MDIGPGIEVELVTSPWAATFYGLLDTVEQELFVASPFISDKPLKRMVEIIENKPSLDSMHVNIVTNLAVDSLLSGSLDVAALLHLVQSIPNSTVTYLPSLHAKIYIVDNKAAIVTSANLTDKGLTGNHEYGILLRGFAVVSKVRDDLTRYASLGNRVSTDTLAALAQAAQELKAMRQQADRSVKARLRAAFEQRTEAAQLELLKARAKGKTTHGIFCDTVLYLLEQKGPLNTADLHPLVQQIHPDLCDDTVDRVIDGVHFGKKWKHYVRNAQQALKRKGFIDFDGQCWFRVV